jgi:hypothetical protein
MQRALRTCVGSLAAALFAAPFATSSLDAQDKTEVTTTTTQTTQQSTDRDDRADTDGFILKGGFSYGDVSNSGVFPGGARTRSGAAIGIAMASRDPIGVGVELLYAQRGIIGEPGSSRELDYLDLPVYLKLATANRNFEPFAYVGPQVSWELRCNSNGGSCPSGRDRISYAGVIGAGARLPTIGGLSIEARYVYGLTDLRLGTVTDTESYKTRSFMVLLGIGF